MTTVTRLIGPPLKALFYGRGCVAAAVERLGTTEGVRLDVVVESDTCRVVATGSDDQRMERCLREALNKILERAMERLLLSPK